MSGTFNFFNFFLPYVEKSKAASGLLLLATAYTSLNSPIEYYIYYKWTKKDVKKTGRFEGQFIIYFHDDNTELIAPIRENLYINISDSFVKSPC